jgi:hypothetical protein
MHPQRHPAGRPIPGLATILATLVLTLALAAPTAALPSGWTSTSRAYATHSVVAHDLAVETGGIVHVATEGGTAAPGVWYAVRAGTTWDRVRVTTGDDRRPSVALDGSAAVIAFVRRSGEDPGLYTATNATGDWVIVRRLAGTDLGAPSLAVIDGTAHLAVRSGTALRYLRGPVDAADATGWSTETADPTCCTGDPSLALTGDGAPRIAYPDGTPASPGGLTIASRTGGTWSRKAVDTRRVSAPALTSDGTKLMVAYVRRGMGTWYAALSGGGSWTLKQLDPGASGPPDVSSFSGSTAFIYGKTGKLTYATMSGGILFSKPFSSVKGDRRPRITRAGGKPVVTFLRVNGGSGDGVLQTRER